MKHLRPHQLFDHVEREDRLVSLCLPRANSLTTMLERAVLAALLKLVKPSKIFEFGTNVGESALIMAANTDATVYSLDLNREDMELVAALFDEHEVRNVESRFAQQPVFGGDECAGRIETLKGDSQTFDYSPYHEKIDFVLVDGGHHLEVVKSDTANAMKMLSGGRPACIVWHDYGNPNYRITEYLEELSGVHELWHVAETSYVFFIGNAGGDVSLVW